MFSDHILCPRASVYYVPGLGGTNPDFFAYTFRQLLESLFGLHFHPTEQRVLSNACRYGVEGDETLLREIKKIMKEHDCCDLVSLVWFAHSHGAKMVCEAYKQLQGTPGFAEIGKSSAIICIGGASHATDDMARVVLNVEYRNDYIARGAANLIGDRDSHVLKIGPFVKGSCSCCEEGAQQKPDLAQSSRTVHGFFLGVVVGFKGLWGSVVGPSPARSNPAEGSSSGPVPSARSVAKQDDERGHYIDGYMACKKWKKLVQAMLRPAPICDRHY